MEKHHLHISGPVGARACVITGVWLLLLLTGLRLHAQDSTGKDRLTVKKLAMNAYHNFFVVEEKKRDTTFFQRSEQVYRPYLGKVIRHIHIRRLPFGESVLDTSTALMGAINRLANNIQSGTQDFIIQQLLFVKAGQRVDPFKVADNERYLRDLDFIKDARITLVQPSANTDTVDMYVVFRDVFSVGGSANASGITDFDATVYDANLFGRAQRLEYTLSYNKNRAPQTGSQIKYRKYSVFGSFTDLEAGYTTINRGISLGDEEENALYVKLDRKLYTPNAKFAGGMQWSMNYSENRFMKPDSLFLDYRYQLNDAWVGYNMGTYGEQTTEDVDNRRRNFIGIRLYRQQFSRKPVLPAFDPNYANKFYALAQSSWYKINFYRTNYIYGFGRTEDIPVGFNQKITTGFSKINDLKRLYLGWEYNGLRLDHKGNYYDYKLALATHYHKGTFNDNSILFNLNWFSRLFSFDRLKIRQFTDVSYAGIYGLLTNEKLGLDNEFGLDGFRTDSIEGTQRLSLGSETAFYTRWKILGFRLGFLTFGKTALIATRDKALTQGDMYVEMGAGIRTRNENLIFGTIECRFTWYPRAPYDMNNISLKLSSNLRLKYSGSFVEAPWLATIR